MYRNTHIDGLIKLLQALQQIHPPFKEKKNSPKLKNWHNFIVIKVFIRLCSLISKKKKSNILKFFTHAFQKKLALIILVQRLHSIITYAVCYSSLSVYKFNRQ